VAGAAARRRDPLGLPDDRAGGGLVGRHQHPVQHPPRRRPLRDQRPQVVRSGAGNPRCAIFIVMGKTDPEARATAQQSMMLVPRDTPGVTVLRRCTVFGYDDAPHGHMEIVLDNVRVPAEQHPARRRPRLRDRPGPPRPGPHPPLHAQHRRGRAGAGDDDRPPVGPHRLRQAAVGAVGLARAHRREPLHDRPGPPADAERRHRWTWWATRWPRPRSR
jgi:hypothetical protein